MCYSLVNYITRVFHCDACDANLKFYILVILLLQKCGA